MSNFPWNHDSKRLSQGRENPNEKVLQKSQATNNKKKVAFVFNRVLLDFHESWYNMW